MLAQLADITDLANAAVAVNPAVATPPADTSWADIGKQLAITAVRDVTGVLAPKIGSALGLNSTSPQYAAALAAQQAAADRSRMLWIVGGLGAAVVLGALVLRR